MSGRKAPSFLLDVDDWLTSVRILGMTPAQEGAYIRLLCHAWRDPNCSLPDDDAALASLSRLGKGWLKGGSQMLRKCFEPHPTILHRLVNQRQLKERERWEHWKVKSAEGGVKSGESRRKKNAKGGSTTVEHEKENINRNKKGKVRSSSTPKSEKKINTLDNQGHGAANAAKDLRAIVGEIFETGYKRVYNSRYPFKSGDWVQFSELRKVRADLTADLWAIACRHYFASEISGGHTMAHLCVKFDVFVLKELDRYGHEPVRGNGSGTPERSTQERAEEIARKIDEGRML